MRTQTLQLHQATSALNRRTAISVVFTNNINQQIIIRKGQRLTAEHISDMLDVGITQFSIIK